MVFQPVDYGEVGSIPHARKILRVEDMPQLDENRGTDTIADTSKADVVDGGRAGRAQNKGLPFQQEDTKAFLMTQDRADDERFREVASE